MIIKQTVATLGNYQVNSWSDYLFNSFSFSFPIDIIFSIVLLMFGVGCVGLSLFSENLLMILVYGELMMVSLVFGFVVISKYFGDFSGQVYALFILNAIAVESSIGLVLLLSTFKVRGSIEYSGLRTLRG